MQLDPNFALAWARLSRADAHRYFFNPSDTASTARRDAAKRALENAQRLEPNSPETLLALGYYQYRVLRDFGPAKTTFERVVKALPGGSDAPTALGLITRREERWDESIYHFERALALDPHNLGLLVFAAWTYTNLRQFSAALRLYDRALDIKPNDPDVMAAKAGIYQAQGNLQEAAGFLSETNGQTPPNDIFGTKIVQLRLERNYGEAIRLLQDRLAQFHFGSDYDKANNQLELALTQRVAGDTTSAKVTAEQARDTFERLYRDQPDNYDLAVRLAQVYAVIGQKDSALKAAQRLMMLQPREKGRVSRTSSEEVLALIQTMVGEKSRAISTLRADPAFQKLCEEKQP